MQLEELVKTYLRIKIMQHVSQVYLELMTATLDVHLKSLPFNESDIAKKEDCSQNPYYIKERDPQDS